MTLRLLPVSLPFSLSRPSSPVAHLHNRPLTPVAQVQFLPATTLVPALYSCSLRSCSRNSSFAIPQSPPCALLGVAGLALNSITRVFVVSPPDNSPFAPAFSRRSSRVEGNPSISLCYAVSPPNPPPRSHLRHFSLPHHSRPQTTTPIVFAYCLPPSSLDSSSAEHHRREAQPLP